MKITVLLLIIAQLSGSLVSAAAHIDWDADCPCVAMSGPVSVSGGAADVITVVNTNIDRQLKILNSLIGFSAALAGKALPGRHKNKSAKNAPAACIIPANTFNHDTQHENSAPAGAWLATALLRAPVVIAAILMLFLSVRRTKLRKCFYLLPRGSIDDIIMSYHIYLNPHRRNAS